MRSSLRLLPLAVATVAVGVSLTANRKSAPVPILRQFPAERFPEVSQNSESASTTSAAENDDEVDTGGPGRLVGKLIGPARNQSDFGNRNHQTADEVASALRRAKLVDFEIDIAVQNGAITLDGTVASEAQLTVAERAAASVEKSMPVNNRLRIATRSPIATGDSDQANTAEFDGSDVLHVGMTVDEVLAALDAPKMDGCWGGNGWTKFWCNSGRFPAKTVSLTFDHDASDTPRLKRWYLIEGR
jgi:hypothetical protein